MVDLLLMHEGSVVTVGVMNHIFHDQEANGAVLLQYDIAWHTMPKIAYVRNHDVCQIGLKVTPRMTG